MRTFTTLVLMLIAVQTRAEAPKIVTDIAPIHSLVAQVMEGVGEPELLISGAASPHDFQFTFAQASAVQDADMVIWAGSELTPWLGEALENLTPEEKRFSLLRSEMWPWLVRRDWDGDHDDHTHNDDSSVDPHAWLNPEVAMVWTRNIAFALRVMDPENDAIYLDNAAATIERLIQLDRDIAAQLAEVPRAAILVPHDAYQYFGARYDVLAVGTISFLDAGSPSPAQIDALLEQVRQDNVVCVLSDPQTRVEYVDLVREGSNAATAVADPLGTTFAPGLDHYDQTLRAIANAYAECLSQ